MNACPGFPATQFGLAFALAVGLVYRFVASLALCVRACCPNPIPAMFLQTSARSVAFAACLLVVTRTLAQLAERARRVEGDAIGAGKHSAGWWGSHRRCCAPRSSRRRRAAGWRC